MTPERWQQIKSIFDRAHDQPEADRAAFVADACAGDELLRREVQALLDQPTSPAFLDALAPSAAHSAPLTASATLSGRRFGVYLVIERIGSGGMGEVYRARDTRLGRDVALKVLPDAFAGDVERLSRFELEARALASLNHPNIATIHGIEDGDGTRGLIMELVPGPTLAEVLQRGALGEQEALPLARQIAEALGAAHDKGIVHRDLKPANLKITAGGAVKVLDFGLAKIIALGDPSSEHPTVDASSRPGLIVGTAAYMSPEQARGQPVDRHSDVWAFGCVLFEMLAGTRAFAGDNVSDILAAVLLEEPDWRLLPSTTSVSIRRLLRRALIKDPRYRLGDMGAVRLEIDDALDGREETGPVTSVSALPTRSPMKLIAAMAVAAILAAAGLGYFMRPAAHQEQRALQFSIVPPEGTSFATIDVGAAPALSPNGRMIAFAAETANGRSLWIQSVDAFDTRPLAGTDGAYGPFWSPDGQWIGFVAGGSLKKVNIMGGQPQVIAPATPSASATTGTWYRNGKILFGSARTLYSVSDGGGDLAQVTTLDATRLEENHYHPFFLPDGRHYLTLVRAGPELQYELSVGDIGSNERRVLLTNVTGAQYAPPASGSVGDVLFVRDGVLLAQPFDHDRLALSGTAAVIAQDVAMNGIASLGDFAVSSSGVLAYRRAIRTGPELAWFDRTGKQVGAIGDRPGNPRNGVRLSPDGKFIAFTRQTDGAQDIWIADATGSDVSRFTLKGGRTPVWSPDGAQIAFMRDGTIYRKPAHAPGDEVAIWSDPRTLSVNDWSGDSRYLLITRWDTSQGLNGRAIWLVPEPLSISTSHEPVVVGPGLHPQFVPGVGAPKWISYEASGQLMLSTLPGATPGTWQVSTDQANGTRWRRDGREAFFNGAGGAYGSLTAAEFDPDAPAFKRGPLRPLFAMPRAMIAAMSQYALGFDVSGDGQRFLSTFPRSDTPSPAIHIVTNWRSLSPR